MAVQTRQASAIILVRDAANGQGLEVLMVRRVIQSDFMPDVYVFPGGSVQQDDVATECSGLCEDPAPGATDPEGRTAQTLGIRAAAIRELFEEAGVLLAYRGTDENLLAIDAENIARFAAYRQALNARQGSLLEIARSEGLRLATERLHYFAHWITPEGMPKRFDTHFFVTIMPAEQRSAYDQLETSEDLWIAPAEALARAEQGTFPLVFATIHQLRELANFASVVEILRATETTYVQTHRPVLVERAGQTHVHLPDDETNTWEVPEHMTRTRT